MRFLHTADWHLGRCLHGASLTPAFEQWCQHVIDVSASEDIDALFISGDVFDQGVPPVVMVDLLAETLEQIAEHTRVIITSGNHDSAKRLGFGAGLMREGIYIRTDSRNAHIPIVIPGRHDEYALIYPIPYLNPDIENVKLVSTDEDRPPLERSHTAVLTEVSHRITADLHHRRAADAEARIILAHAFISGAEPSESERSISIGGAEAVAASVFHCEGLIDYVALGHLHRPQRVGDPQHGPLMRYSGSPIAFSFSEEQQQKTSIIYDTTAVDPIEYIPAPVYRPLATLTGTLDELLSPRYCDYQDHFLRIYITDPERPQHLHEKLLARFPQLLTYQHLCERSELAVAEMTQIRSDPLTVLTQFFTSTGGRELDTAEQEIIDRTWREVIKEEQCDFVR
ncbi:exonuclease SbcCD subunit D [Trueperella sp. LYQ143]|uniref:exonuclease SbcCD subunit D n=1 Tax=Trueperella sp. LYQ143 TaxID=3391059 RepID=UPI0039837EFF